MEITVIIPTRGDRPEFLKQALKIIDRQTLQPDEIIVIEDENGVTGNIKAGYTLIKEGIVIIIEDDDFYPPDYIEFIRDNWSDDIDLLGFESSFSYHLGQRKWMVEEHPNRSSMCSTVIRAGLDILWPPDPYPFLDIELWKQATSGKFRWKLIPIYKVIGIKHGIGKCGGSTHKINFPYKNRKDKGNDNHDPDMNKLMVITDNDPFYIHLSNELQK